MCRRRQAPLLLPALLLLAAAAQLAHGGRLAERRVPDTGRDLLLVGGTEVGQEERYGYIARIHFLLDGRLGLLGGCGGTLIARRVVLTAAHCTALANPGAGNVFVRVGAFNPLTDGALRKGKYALRRVVRIVEHPGYVHGAEDQVTSANDLALMLLDAPVPEGIPAVRLPDAATPYPAGGSELHALGWGSTDSENTQPAHNLMDLALPAVNLELCRRQWGFAGAAPSLLRAGHVCAGLQWQRNICFGDSGGPLVVRGGGAGQDVQLGVISFSFPTCALPGMPGVFTFIPQYRAWIDQELAKLELVPVASVQAAAVQAAAVPAAPANATAVAVLPAANPAAGLQHAASLEAGPVAPGEGQSEDALAALLADVEAQIAALAASPAQQQQQQDEAPAPAPEPTPT